MANISDAGSSPFKPKTQPRLALVVSDSAKAQKGARTLRDAHDWVSPEEADVLVVVGGDGFCLHVLHELIDRDEIKPCFGLNLGTLGFLMNGKKDTRSIIERVMRSRRIPVSPLRMEVTTGSGTTHSYYAINEVSLLRETRQTAKIEVIINGKTRMAELAGDGILLATPVGSTAYNLSANGPILPLGCRMLAMTPISPFRPRRWRGAILPERAEVEFRIREPAKRPVAAVADQKEVRDVSSVRIVAAKEKELTLLFDPGLTLEDRIFDEQFQV